MKKLLSKRGFTLMEMLIVIAIIVILVAISIPAFSGSLEKAKKAADMSNLRSAQAAYLVQDMDGFFTKAENAGKYFYYDLAAGEFVAVGALADVPGEAQGSCKNHSTGHIKADVANGKAVWSVTGYENSCE